MRHGITWMGAIVALCSFTASHAEDAQIRDRFWERGLQVTLMTLWGL